MAQRAAGSPVARPRLRKVAADPVLTAVVQGGLDALWSPEQISASLAAAFPNDPARRLATESIYQALYADGAVLQRDPTSCLRSGRRRRRPHRRADRRRSSGEGAPGARRPIGHRPAEAEDRQVPGHWEGDLIIALGVQPVGDRDPRRAHLRLYDARSPARPAHRRCHGPGPDRGRAPTSFSFMAAAGHPDFDRLG